MVHIVNGIFEFIMERVSIVIFYYHILVFMLKFGDIKLHKKNCWVVIHYNLSIYIGNMTYSMYGKFMLYIIILDSTFIYNIIDKFILAYINNKIKFK